MDARVDIDEPDPKEMHELVLRLMRGVNGQAFRLFGDKVHSGPFGGMTIPVHTSFWDDGNSSAKLLGVYEHELHAAIEYAIWRRPRTVINVGCAEGYYTIGMARRGFTVYGLDINSEALVMCEDYAERNSVKVDLRSGARMPEELLIATYFEGHRLYIIDCEGDEEILVDLDRCPELCSADIIVECHDFLKPGVSTVIADRLSATHRVELVVPRLPDFGRLRFLERFPTVMGILMAVEKRPMPCYWLTCWANTRASR